MHFEFNPGRILRWLLMFTAIFVALGIAVQVLRYVYGFNYQLGFYRLLNLASDANAPTWYSSILLLYCAALLILIARLKSGESRLIAWGWWGLATVFTLLSMDEVARIHETLGHSFRLLFLEPQRDYLHYAWVIPGMAFVALFALAYIPFLVRLPPFTRWGFVISGSVFVGGAIGVEMISANHIYNHGNDLRVHMIIALEETLEMLGAVAFAHVLGLYLVSQTDGFALKMR